MPKSQSLVKPRTSAFLRQKGRCYYCNMPMWQSNPSGFSDKFGLHGKEVGRFQCTGEHLIARQDGGTSATANIVAACRFCNQQRHSRKQPLEPDRYINHVRQRLAKGKWHPRHLQSLLIGAGGMSKNSA